ncbi:MAG TPA: NAD(P)/FAD-dependent oxidoreductase [Lacunisphaera sp.]|jgi:monoamine oxidase
MTGFMETTAASRKPIKVDVIVIGAGVSGLAAAGALAKKGWNVTLLEARHRAGGRILSARPAGWPTPIELGAEFVHGGNPAMGKLLKRAALRTRILEPNVWWRDAHSGVLARIPDYWERIESVVNQISKTDSDESFQQFLNRCQKNISPADRFLAAHYVGGFEAAPTAKISADALRRDHAGTTSTDFKIHGRYDKLIDTLERALPANRVHIRLNSPVVSLQWQQGQVVVEVRRGPRSHQTLHRAQMVLVTLPLGVLQAGKMKFIPPLKNKSTLIAKMGWGHVVRIVLRFKRGFWSAPFVPHSLGKDSGRDFGFVNAPGLTVPVWWALTSPTPVLTGWAGGDVSKKLLRRSPAQIRDEAVRSLAAIFGTTAKELKSWLADWRCHPWSDDPFSLGAYSFPAAGLEHGDRQLARPVSSTIFFAGEATAREYGTVHGALESGLRAAKEMETVLRRRVG